MSDVELFRSGDDYQPKMHLSIRAPNGTLFGVGTVELQGLQYGAYASIDGVDSDDVEALLTEVAQAAASIISKHIGKVRAFREAALAKKSKA